MTYFGPNLPRNVGVSARKSAMAPRRALDTAAACEAPRIGITAAKLSSDARISAAALRKASPFFRELVVRYADTKTRNSTISADGGGNSSGADWSAMCRALGIAPANHSEADAGMNKHGKRVRRGDAMLNVHSPNPRPLMAA